MIARIQWVPSLVEEIPNGQYNALLRQERLGVMLHFDGSWSDRGAIVWFSDPTCRVSYQLLVLDDGSYVRIAPDSARAWHAGKCRPSSDQLQYTDANSAFYGISAATNARTQVTALQMLTMAWLCRRYFEEHGWGVTETWRIVGHETEAWERGRRTDPSGGVGDNPILSVEDIRMLLGRVLV